jgi:hypothetical protein
VEIVDNEKVEEDGDGSGVAYDSEEEEGDHTETKTDDVMTRHVQVAQVIHVDIQRNESEHSVDGD